MSLSSSSRHGPLPGADATTPVAEAAFPRLFQELAPFVWRALRRLGVQERDCEDVLQEVFLTVHKKLPEFEQRSSLRTWVYGICLRKAQDYRRLARVTREVGEQGRELSASAPNQEQTLEVNRARALLDSILDQLDDDKRAVFVMFEWEALSMSEVAGLVGVPVQTAYARLYAARKHVQAALGVARGGENSDDS
jgi:RNA polymerase sigma-70 factor (ECF subfamily)